MNLFWNTYTTKMSILENKYPCLDRLKANEEWKAAYLH